MPSNDPRDAVIAAARNLKATANVNRTPIYGLAVVPTSAFERLEKALAALSGTEDK
jgi:hypothetical protein